jgi:cytidylate kinase
MIVTISRQMGAGGSELARRVAEALGWRVVDNELVDRVAARCGLAPEEVAEREEQAPGFLERLIRMASRAAPELTPAPAEPAPGPEAEDAMLVRATEAAVAELADEGRVVLVGRAAPAVLGSDRDALHVKVVAPLADRVAAIATRRGARPQDVESEVRRSDDNRRRYHRQFYDRDWDDAAQYHLVLNTAALGPDAAVAVIVERARARWPDATAGGAGPTA